jgi:hypothetical protein
VLYYCLYPFLFSSLPILQAGSDNQIETAMTALDERFSFVKIHKIAGGIFGHLGLESVEQYAYPKP